MKWWKYWPEALVFVGLILPSFAALCWISAEIVSLIVTGERLWN